ncbi:TonB-dependent hemoglobin/transferrin/lactoferrin family receptor [Ferrimonas kyonanensis]|uniref:TonB-dependent hemoglobin/transferrin/lactoferrin family receptor n=1 Tax=Ferrimonas kyonanensis TaxID=364763 RepID=UPI000426C00B|nr:TonB-dependent hemoglobin/transferrin/lactoferrin family receptor [Ferrimonas kyonanensis]
MKLSPLSLALMSAMATTAACGEEAATEFNEVVVTANKVSQSLSKTAGSVAVIDADTIEREGATELYDVLNREPGVAVTGGAGRPQNIVIRGMTGNRIAVVKDGIRVTDGYGANDLNDNVGRNSFDLSEVKQIEVVKGASSSVFGSGAIGGVVMVTTKTAEDYLKDKDLYIGADATYTGISDKARGTATLATRFGNTDSLLRAAYWNGSESNNHDSSNYNRDIDGYSGAFTLSHYWSDDLLLRAKASYYREQMTRNEGTALMQLDGGWHAETFWEQTLSDSLEAYVGLEHDRVDGFYDSLESKLYWRDSQNDADKNVLMYQHRNDITVKRRQIETRKFNDQLTGLSANLLKQVSWLGYDHQMAYGVLAESTEHQRPIHKTIIDWNGFQPTEYVPFVPAKSNTLGVYWRDVITKGAWTLTPGLRFDLHQLKPDGQNSIGGVTVDDNTSQELSPSLSLGYQWNPSWNLYASYNHGYRAPTYDKVFGYNNHDFVPITPFILIPNLELKAETSDNLEIGSKFDDGRWLVYVAAFYSTFDDFIDVQDIGRDPEHQELTLRQYENLNGVKTYGAELTLGYRFTDHWQLNSKAGVVWGKDDQDNYIRTMTPIEGSLTLDYADDTLSGFARINWAAAMDKTPSCSSDIGIEVACASTSGWASVDMGVSYQLLDSLDLSLTLFNLFDRKYTRYQDVAGTAADQSWYSTQPGRYFTLNARYAF